MKAFAKALKMDFETKVTETQYNPEFVKQVLAADKSAKKAMSQGLKIPKTYGQIFHRC